MYFFQSVLLIFIIIISSFMIYQFVSDNKKINRKNAILLYLAFIQTMFIIFSNNMMFVIFLDFSCFLGYLLRRRKEAFLLSIVNIVYCSMFLTIPWYYYLVYIGYLGLDYLLTNHRKDSLNFFIICKSFLTSFVYFLYFEHSALGIGYLAFILLYFYSLLELSYNFLKKFETKNNDDSLIFQIAHEVKNPIAICKGYLDMLDTNKKDKVNKYIPIVKSEMNRALTIMDDFLNLKRLTVQKDIMDITLLLEDVTVTMDSILSNKNVILELPNIDEEILLDGDYDRLKQVFVNLIKNAYEANATKIKLETVIKKDIVEITIIDDGDGINEKDLKKVGQLFYTTKTKGTGIGVNMSKEIIKLHQGNIKYDSKLGKGTSVIIELPYYMSF